MKKSNLEKDLLRNFDHNSIEIVNSEIISLRPIKLKKLERIEGIILVIKIILGIYQIRKKNKN